MKEKVNILLVDDKEDKLSALETILAGHDYNLVKAPSGKEALRHILTDEFAVILLDVQMPDMDGFETAELIRKRKKSENTPIIFITAYNKTEIHTLRGYSLGAVDYMFIPIEPEILKAKVKVFAELFRKTKKIEHQKMLLESSNKELEVFAYSVSHDLRAPLRHINSFGKLLKKHTEENPDEKTIKYMDIILDSVEKIDSFIDGLLEFSRIGRIEMWKKKVNLISLIEEVKKILQNQIEGRNIIWNIRPLPDVDGDPLMIRCVMQNLIENALKYTANREEVHIEISSQNGNNEKIISIRDNGAGFDMKHADKIFGIFQRLHSEKEFKGRGIGLANVHKIISRHGGKVWAEGEVGKGAVFYFSIPCICNKQKEDISMNG